jgi:dihydroorotase
VIDPDATWSVEPASIQSRSKNTPFGGRPLSGRAVLTIVSGTIVFAEEKRFG